MNIKDVEMDRICMHAYFNTERVQKTPQFYNLEIMLNFRDTFLISYKLTILPILIHSALNTYIYNIYALL